VNIECKANLTAQFLKPARGALILVSCLNSCQHAGPVVLFLCMMIVHREKISKDKQGFIERVIDRFGRVSRRLQLLLLSKTDKSCS